MWVPSLDQKNPLEESMATHSSILAWRITWTEEPGRLHVCGVTRSRTRLSLHTHTIHSFRRLLEVLECTPCRRGRTAVSRRLMGSWCLGCCQNGQRKGDLLLSFILQIFFSICHQQNLAENQLTQEAGKNILQGIVPLIAQSKQEKSEEGI